MKRDDSLYVQARSCLSCLSLPLPFQRAATSRGNRDVPSGARSACRMRATLQAPVCPAGTRKRGGRHRISPDLLRLHAEPRRGAGLLRNSGRCTSFSLNLHTSLMRHPSSLPRPTVKKTPRDIKPNHLVRHPQHLPHPSVEKELRREKPMWQSCTGPWNYGLGSPSEVVARGKVAAERSEGRA